LTVADVALLASYCAAYGAFVEATKALREGGLTHETTMGVYPRAEIKIQRDAAAQMRTLGAELGLSPAARTRINVRTTENQDDQASQDFGD